MIYLSFHTHTGKFSVRKQISLLQNFSCKRTSQDSGSEVLPIECWLSHPFHSMSVPTPYFQLCLLINHSMGVIVLYRSFSLIFKFSQIKYLYFLNSLNNSQTQNEKKKTFLFLWPDWFSLVCSKWHIYMAINSDFNIWISKSNKNIIEMNIRSSKLIDSFSRLIIGELLKKPGKQYSAGKSNKIKQCRRLRRNYSAFDCSVWACLDCYSPQVEQKILACQTTF